MTNRDFVNQLALRGAQTRLAELDAERNALLSAFPDLSATAVSTNHRAASIPGAPNAGKRKTYTMSAAQKKAVSKRMRAYWAARRSEKEGTPKAKPQRRKSRPRKSPAAPAEVISQQF